MGVSDWQKRYLAKPAEPAGGQDERRIRAAARTLVRLCWQAIKGRQQGVLPPRTIIQSVGISMTEEEACKVHIQYTFHVLCKI